MQTATAVLTSLENKISEITVLEEPSAAELIEKAKIGQQIGGVRKVLSELSRLHTRIISDKCAKGISIDWTKDVNLIMGREVLLQTISSMRKKITNQRKALRALNRQNKLLRWKLTVDLHTMEDSKSRWILLTETSNSGKQLFQCKVCGRISPIPDKDCKTIQDGYEAMGCSLYPNHPKILSDKAKINTAVHFLEEALAEKQSWQLQLDKTELAYQALTTQKDTDIYRSAGCGTREFARIVKERLEELSKAPKKRNEQLEELTQICDSVSKGAPHSE
jgi:hypothetical protein